MKKKTSIILFILFLFAQIDISAQSTAVFPRLEPDPKALEYFHLGDDDVYSWQALAEISLWASGDINASTMPRVIAAAEAIKNSPDLPGETVDQAEFVLNYMHRNILRSYSLYQTRVDTIFTNGRYNCVSSAVLYMILCKSLGISSFGVITRAHAFVKVGVGEIEYDVETTNRYGFNPGNRKEFHDEFGRLTGFSYVPPQNYRDRQTIGDIELISLIFNNRIFEQERQNRYAQAVPLAVDRTALLLGSSPAALSKISSWSDLFKDPYLELLDRIFNYGAGLLRGSQEENALRWAAAASEKYPDPERWQEFVMAAVNNRLSRFLRENNVTQARTFFDSNKNLLTEENQFKLLSILTEAELLRAANQLTLADDCNEFIPLVESALRNGYIPANRAREIIIFAIQRTASQLATPPGTRNPTGETLRIAIKFLQDSIESHGTGRELEQALGSYRSALANDYHNRFAAEWNRGNHDEARRILDEGLAEFPDNRQLLNNRDRINR